MAADDDEWTADLDAALMAAGLFTESGTRKVKKIPRGPGGQWMKRRSSTPVHGLFRGDDRYRRVPVPVYDLDRTPLSGLPADVYERLAELVGGRGKPAGWANDTIAVIRAVKDRPDAPVRVYTAAPPETTSIRPGDWISIAQGFARARAKAYPRWRLLAATVPAAQVLTRSDDLLRWTLAEARPTPRARRITL